MTFIATVTYYDDMEDKRITTNQFVVGDNHTDAVGKLIKYYGESDTKSIYVELFSPDDFLVFDEDIADIFNVVKTRLGERIIW